MNGVDSSGMLLEDINSINNDLMLDPFCESDQSVIDEPFINYSDHFDKERILTSIYYDNEYVKEDIYENDTEPYSSYDITEIYHQDQETNEEWSEPFDFSKLDVEKEFGPLTTSERGKTCIVLLL